MFFSVVLGEGGSLRRGAPGGEPMEGRTAPPPTSMEGGEPQREVAKRRVLQGGAGGLGGLFVGFAIPVSCPNTDTHRQTDRRTHCS